MLLGQRELLEEGPGIVGNQGVVGVRGVKEVVIATRTTIHHLSSGFAGFVRLANAARRHLVLRALVIRQPFVDVSVSRIDFHRAVIQSSNCQHRNWTRRIAGTDGPGGPGESREGETGSGGTTVTGGISG